MRTKISPSPIPFRALLRIILAHLSVQYKISHLFRPHSSFALSFRLFRPRRVRNFRILSHPRARTMATNPTKIYRGNYPTEKLSTTRRDGCTFRTGIMVKLLEKQRYRVFRCRVPSCFSSLGRHIYIYIYIHIYRYTQQCYIYVYKRVQIHTLIDMSTYINRYTHTYVYIHRYIFVYLCTFTYIYAYKSYIYIIPRVSHAMLENLRFLFA